MTPNDELIVAMSALVSTASGAAATEAKSFIVADATLKELQRIAVILEKGRDIDMTVSTTPDFDVRVNALASIGAFRAIKMIRDDPDIIKGYS